MHPRKTEYHHPHSHHVHIAYALPIIRAHGKRRDNHRVAAFLAADEGNGVAPKFALGCRQRQRWTGVPDKETKIAPGVALECRAVGRSKLLDKYEVWLPDKLIKFKYVER